MLLESPGMKSDLLIVYARAVPNGKLVLSFNRPSYYCAILVDCCTLC